MSTQLRFKRLFSFAFGSLAMLAVALLSAFVTMRLAIHGRETEIPSFSGLTIRQAQERAHSKGLNLLVENRFYSTIMPAGHILSQIPSPGQTVRRDWQVRVAESLGAQRVSIPDVVGQSERSATLALRRLGLDLGAVSRIPSEALPDTILAQTPPPNAQGVDGPRVSFLVSEPAEDRTPEAIVMPSLTGLSPAAAQTRAAAGGLHIVANLDPDVTSAEAPDPDANIVSAPSLPTGNVVSQYPAAGHHVLRGAGVHVTYAHPVTPDSTTSPTLSTVP